MDPFSISQKEADNQNKSQQNSYEVIDVKKWEMCESTPA